MNLPDLIAAITDGRARDCVADGVPFRMPLVVNHGAGGLGEALLGLCAVAGLRKLHPEQRVIYRVRASHLPYLELFEMGDTVFGPHDWDGSRGD